MDIIKIIPELICIAWNLFISSIKMIIDLIPVFKQLSDLQTQFLATALGVSPFVITLIGFLLKILNFVKDK
jgi:hypothetical protein